MVCNERNVNTKWHNPADLDFKIPELQTLFLDDHHVLHAMFYAQIPVHGISVLLGLMWHCGIPDNKIKLVNSYPVRYPLNCKYLQDCLQGGQESKGWLARQYTTNLDSYLDMQ